MGLNKQSGDMYEWITHTWNPLGGECPHECEYCYVDELKKNPVLKEKYSGEPRLYEKELDYNHKDDQVIFVCNMSDLFAVDVPDYAITEILGRCNVNPKTHYLFQTKNPERIRDHWHFLPEHSTICVTLESNRDCESYAPIIVERVNDLKWLRVLCWTQENKKLYITIEPVMDFNLDEFKKDLWEINPDKVSIGADSKNSGLPEPSPEKLEQLITYLEGFTEVHLKKNLQRLLK